MSVHLKLFIGTVLAATQNGVELVPRLVQTALVVGHHGESTIVAAGTVVDSGATLFVPFFLLVGPTAGWDGNESSRFVSPWTTSTSSLFGSNSTSSFGPPGSRSFCG